MAKSFGLYVTLIRDNKTGRQTESYEITYKNRVVISVHEILSYFDALDFKLNEKIWIKRHDLNDFRAEPFGMASQLPWLDFHKCIVVLAPDIFSARKMLSPHQTAQAESHSEEKRERKGPPRYVEQRQYLLRVIKKRKNKKRLETKKDPDT